jgi:C1A family cysteine protease
MEVIMPLPFNLSPLNLFDPFGMGLADALEKLGITSVEEAIGAANAAPVELARYLGIDLRGLPIPHLPIPIDLLTIVQKAVYAFGVPTAPVLADYVPGQNVPASPAAPAVRSLADDFAPPPRHQGGRRTCTAFASIATLEQNVRRHPPLIPVPGFDLSDGCEQWLYYLCKRHYDNNNTFGTFIATAYQAMTEIGNLPEASWPYRAEQTPQESGEPTPAGEDWLRPLAAFGKIKRDRALQATDIGQYKAAIDAQRAVTFWVPVFDSWFYNPLARILGLITMPIPSELSKQDNGHSMCIVGYIDQPQFPGIGGGRFIVRNSWGGEWGLLNPWDEVQLPQGFGTIPYDYIAKFGREARIIEQGPFE